VFGLKGYHDATLKEVAELAEFSVGSVYSFFDSKDDLFRQIFIRRGDEFMDGMRELLAAKRPAMQQLHDLIDFEIGFFREHPRFGRLFLRVSSAALQSADRVADAVMISNYEESMSLQADLFRRGQRAKQFVVGDPAAMSRLLSGLVSSFQAIDPRVMSDDPDRPERMSVEEFHALVERAFTR
jgi:TetR/AcrR family transcriptional regulator